MQPGMTGGKDDTMVLGANNGLAAMITRETQGTAKTYLNGETISVHWYDATQPQIDRLKILIADYIARHMMMDSYKRVDFYY